VVGDAIFELATPWTQTKCATKLRYQAALITEYSFEMLHFIRGSKKDGVAKGI